MTATFDDKKEKMRVVALISGGIDSPVAAHLMLSKGMDVVAIHFDNGSFGDPHSIEKVKKIVAQLERIHGKTIKLRIIPHGGNLRTFVEKCDRHKTCVLCKRMMLRIAEEAARKEGASALVMGDSIGQVASQTLHNLRTETCVVKMPILRPLVGLDKTEIINIAKNIGTFDISIESAGACKAVPSKPATRSRLEDAEREEAKLDIAALVSSSLSGSK